MDFLTTPSSANVLAALSVLQRFALKPKPKDFLKVLRSNTFKKSFVVRLSGLAGL